MPIWILGNILLKISTLTKTSERVKWGQKRRMEQGVVFGRDMLGYRVKSGRLEIIPEEAEIVRSIFYKYLHEGKGTNTHNGKP